MGSNIADPITELLIRWNAGEETCRDRLIPLLEHELHRIAHHHMQKEREGHTLQTTALVNEAYLKLVDQSRTNWANRAHFLAVASGIMRHFLVDHARGLCRERRGGAKLRGIECRGGCGSARRAPQYDHPRLEFGEGLAQA